MHGPQPEQAYFWFLLSLIAQADLRQTCDGASDVVTQTY